MHIDGFIAVSAQTVILTSESVTGRMADATLAAFRAAEQALGLLRPGNSNVQVSGAVYQTVRSFNCQPVEGVLSHEMRRFVIDEDRVIANAHNPNEAVEEVTFREYDVFGLDIVVTTGNGKTSDGDYKTTVYKKNPSAKYDPRVDSARKVQGEINKRFPVFPFTVRSLKTPKNSLGVLDLVNHNVLQKFPVYKVHPNEFVAQFKVTAVVLPDRTLLLTPFAKPHATIVAEPSNVEMADPEADYQTPGDSRKRKARKQE